MGMKTTTKTEVKKKANMRSKLMGKKKWVCLLSTGLIAAQFSHITLAAEANISVPNTDTKIGFGGKIHVDLIVDTDDMDNQTGFSPATIATTDDSENIKTRLSAGQSKFQFVTATDVEGDSVDTLIEWDFYNTDNSSDFHLTQLWAEYKGLGGGQTFSVFMDISTFPNTLEYWGPNSMVFVRQPQIRYTLGLGESQRLAFAIEKPSSSIDDNSVNGFSGGSGYEQIPDLTGHWRLESGASHLQVAGILRQLGYAKADDDTETTLGYGLNVTGNWQFTKSDKLNASFTAGEGIGRYVNDTSWGRYDHNGNPRGQNNDAIWDGDELTALPVMGFFAFWDHAWTDKINTNLGYGYLEVDNEDTQANDAFKNSQFAVVNFLYQWAKPVTIGTELQWGDYEEKGGDSGENLRWQSSVIYRF